MAKDIRLLDGFGTDNRVKISSDGYLNVQMSTDPPFAQETLMTIYREFMTTSSGTTSMIAATAGSEFSVRAETGYDIYIKTLSFLMAGTGLVLDGWGGGAGAGTALTNGCSLYYEDENGIITVADQLRRNYDVIRLCLGQPTTGGSADAFVVNNTQSTSESVIPQLNFSQFGFKYGIKLKAGSPDKIVFRFNDSMVGESLTNMNIIAYGVRRKIN